MDASIQIIVATLPIVLLPTAAKDSRQLAQDTYYVRSLGTPRAAGTGQSQLADACGRR
jgi:hypothetical protein